MRPQHPGDDLRIPPAVRAQRLSFRRMLLDPTVKAFKFRAVLNTGVIITAEIPKRLPQEGLTKQQKQKPQVIKS